MSVVRLMEPAGLGYWFFPIIITAKYIFSIDINHQCLFYNYYYSTHLINF